MTTPSAVESIFFAALEKPDPGERAAYLDAACQGDSDLRRRVERLLEARPQVGNFLQQPLADSPEAVARHAGEGACGADPHPRPERGAETLTHEAGSPEAGAVPDFLTPSRKPGSLGRLDHYEIL